MSSPCSHRNLRLSLALAFVAVELLGCSGGPRSAKPTQSPDGKPSPLSTEGPSIFGTAKPAPAGQVNASWTIVIASFAGDGMENVAQEALDKVRTKGSLPQAYIERRGKSMVVAYGQYTAPDSKNAQQDLKRIQGITIDEAAPFEGAVLAPPPFATLPGSIPEYDLSVLKQKRGKGAMYTLQVGAYARMDGKPTTAQDLAEFRAAAEKAAVELRREGEEAFYHHGRSMSVVTVGVFGEKDLHSGKESMAMAEARKRHPLNLVNGEGIKVRTRGQAEAQLQPSRIIEIPD